MISKDTLIYLDIDGTLIHEDLDHYNQPAAHLQKFFEAIKDYEVFWLTTHCRDGNTIPAQRHLIHNLEPDLHNYFINYKGTVWDVKKTEGIDFSKPFLWFDNDVMHSELKDLEKNGASDSLIKVNLRKNPNQLGDIVRDLFL